MGVELGEGPHDGHHAHEAQQAAADHRQLGADGRRDEGGLDVPETRPARDHQDVDGGDPASIAFCDEIGLDYVSCSPYRVPVARLAAAQAAIAHGGDGS
jgi:hypothetical protein